MEDYGKGLEGYVKESVADGKAKGEKAEGSLMLVRN